MNDATATAVGPPDRVVEVSPERLSGWLGRFGAAHGEGIERADGDDLVVEFPDGARVRLVDRWGGGAAPDATAWIAGQRRDRRVALLLVRRSAHAVGLAVGAELPVHHVDTHYVQGRTKAGGWSQQRYARRRDNQSDHALGSAADDAVRVLLPIADRIDALVCGGDTRAVDIVLADRRLAPLAARRTRHPVLPVPDPRLAVLRDVVVRMRMVPVRISDPPSPPQ
ncbi:MAG: acVLRF1 family peptidyl-tRNA hydrolase [Propionibacterium sp.]|nr:acVLRF1 family peptidyl-tRNA hydrolase [Propionibacterium sp.]